MDFQIEREQPADSSDLDVQVAVLSDANNRLEVWPGLGFNACRWQAAGQEWLYHGPTFFADKRSTRGGFPILFPFPNRIHAGHFSWAGQSYQLPINDPAHKNAIHGFAHQKAWRVIDEGTNPISAWLTGEFQASLDAPEANGLWPADHRLRLTYRLLDRILRVEAEVFNPDSKPLPFGIGFHPYFALAPFGGAQATVTAGAEKMWELLDNLPTGRILDVDERRDVRLGKSYSSLQLDDVLTGLHPFAVDPPGLLNLVGTVGHPSGERLLTLWAAPDFRELVLFTPPHREAVCLEPYTCATDAINLSQRGIDAGLRVLQPGERWQGALELHVSS